MLFYCIQKAKEFIFNLEDVRETDIAESTYKRFKKILMQLGKYQI